MLNDGQTKQCKKCGQVKSLNDFSTYLNKKSGNTLIQGKCKICVSEYARLKYNENLELSRKKQLRKYYDNIDNFRKYYQNNKQKISERNRKKYTTLEGRANAIYNSAKRRARINKLEFTITKDFILTMLELGKCAKSGIDFCFDDPLHGKTRNKYSPSIDKKDQSKGYTIENSQIVVWCYNTGKGEMSDNEFIEFCKKIAEFNK